MQTPLKPGMPCLSDVGDLDAACENLSAVIRSLVSTGAELSSLEDPLSGQGSATFPADLQEPASADSWLNQTGSAGQHMSSDDLWLKEAMCDSTTHPESHREEQGLPSGFTTAHNVFDYDTSGCRSSSCSLPCPNTSGSCVCDLVHQVSCQVADCVTVSETNRSCNCMNTGCTVGSSRGVSSSGDLEHVSHTGIHAVPLKMPCSISVPHTSENACHLLASCLTMRAEARRRLGQPGAVWMADLQRAALLLARGP